MNEIQMSLGALRSAGKKFTWLCEYLGAPPTRLGAPTTILEAPVTTMGAPLIPVMQGGKNLFCGNAVRAPGNISYY
jgi:hypothetical protein